MRAAGWLLAVAALPAGAAELLSVGFDRLEDRYVFESEALFEVGVEPLYGVFLDYDLSPRFSGAIVEARNLPPGPDGLPGFYVLNRGCVMFFCKSFERYGVVESEPPVMIRARIDPERSDFEFSDETWQFRPDGDDTIVRYRVEFEPRFWVPPVLGPWMIRRTLAARGGEAIQRIEAIARERAE